ncbi:MAG TPA: orotate phosphoribosyltransferase [Nitrolancea sp.]
MDFDALLREVGALKDGHFVLSSGRHSDRYVEKFDLLRQPAAAERACAALIELLPSKGDIDIVAGPTTGGILLAFEVARQLKLPAAYAERAEGGSLAREFRRGTTFPAGARVLVVDDILTTGGSVRETLGALEAHDVRPVAVAVLVDRSGGKVAFGVPLISLSHMEIDTWAPDDCPLCREGLPITKPGTTGSAGPA